MAYKKTKLPIGIQSFRTLIEDEYVYVDKTKYIHELIQTGTFYFLSRPRRFGKSLLLSTFKELFSGNKKLFNITVARIPPPLLGGQGRRI